MVEEEFKKKNKDLLDSWVSDIISSFIGLASVGLSLAKVFDWRGNIALLIFGLALQIPIIYYKIYLYFCPKENNPQ